MTDKNTPKPKKAAIKPKSLKNSPQKAPKKSVSKKTSATVCPGIIPQSDTEPKVWDTPNGKHPGGRPRKYQTVEEMQQLIDRFFAEADLKEEPYTITGLGLVLGLDRMQIIDYGKIDEFSSAIKEARLRVENYAEKRLFGSNATGPIFALKNFKWTDKQELEHSGKDGGAIEINIKRKSIDVE